MNFAEQDDQRAIQEAVAAICKNFDADYWLQRDTDGEWPTAFCNAIAAGGWFGGTMPTE